MPHTESGHVQIGQTRISYSIRRSKRRRRSIGLLVGREGELRILAPARTGLAAIEDLIRRQTAWIGRRLDRLHHHRELHPPPGFAPGENIPYRGEHLTLRISENRDQPQGCVIEGEALIVNLPNAGLSAAARREEIRLEIMLWYKKKVRLVFRERMEHWSEITGLRPRRLVVANARRQWGSCSAANDIRLNWRLVTAAPELLDYVIVHELCHIPHKNHSRRFWELVERFVPDRKALRKRLHALDPGFRFLAHP